MANLVENETTSQSNVAKRRLFEKSDTACSVAKQPRTSPQTSVASRKDSEIQVLEKSLAQIVSDFEKEKELVRY